MRKLSEQELKDLKEQLGGDVRVFDEPLEDTSEKAHVNADARVPSLEELKDETPSASEASHSASDLASKRRDSIRGKARKNVAKSRNGSSDFSVRFGPKNSDKGSKVAIVSSKSKKIVYEQG